MPSDAPSHLSLRNARRLAALMRAQGWHAPLMQAAVEVVWPGAPADLAAKTMAAWTRPYPPDAETLARLLEDLFWAESPPPDLPLITAPPALTPPLAPFTRLDLPVLASAGELAEWLNLAPAQLAWFADCAGRLARPGDAHLAHYTQTWIPKRTGRRLLEVPRPKLKSLQRKILSEILDPVPAHPQAFGFVKGRNCLGHAARHAGEQVVVTLDLADFFPSVPGRRIHAIFRCLGYPHAVARLLTGLCTTRTPHDVLPTLPRRDRQTYRAPHLPQGAPTSPALANLSAYRLDVRLSALARRLGANYSRYADDLAFSGDRGLVFDSGVPLLEQAQEIISDEGFRPNLAKTRIMRRGRTQRVTGLVVNNHINVARKDFDRLKAVLTNCLRHGAASQNREGRPDFRAHLDGRIGWVEQVNRRRGAKLRHLFERIRWD